MLSILLWTQKAKEKHFFSLLPFLLLRFLGEKRHMSYHRSGCGGLNMYNTSRHDHFLWLKPLKMAPCFLKPIDLPSKSVCICPEITCTFQLKNTAALLVWDTTRKQILKVINKLTRNISIFYDSQMWLVHHKYMVVTPLGSTGSPLDNVTVFVLCRIYCPGRNTDRQKPTVAHMPVNPTWYIMQRRKKENHHSFIPPQRNPMQIAQFLTFLGRK